MRGIIPGLTVAVNSFMLMQTITRRSYSSLLMKLSAWRVLSRHSLMTSIWILVGFGRYVNRFLVHSFYRKFGN